jgi:glucose/mannose transport system substrate-binding protein
MLGFDILDWAGEGALGDLTATADRRRLGQAVVPAALQGFSKADGKWIAAPVNVHSTNWVWINKAALDATGLAAPKTWEELVAVLDKMKEAGITPLGHGGQPWQDATVFDGSSWAWAPTSTRRPSSTLTPRPLAARKWPRPSTA